MNNYKLLVYKEDFGDEFDVPALHVMTNEEYQIWLKTPSGELNPNYDKELAIYNENEAFSLNFWSALRREGIENTTRIPKDRTDLLKLEQLYRKNHRYMSLPNKVESNLYPRLGNYGEGFSEQFSSMYLMEEFVEKGFVIVYDVSEEFAKTFNNARLSSLSLCNIFTIGEDY